MSVLRFRSLTDALNEGSTDGKYRKVRPDTNVYPGDGGDLVIRERAGLHPFMNYGFLTQEYPDKVNPASM